MDRFPECGKPIDLDRGADLTIEAAKVPYQLTHLIPLVNKWSFDSLDDQDVFVDRIKRDRPHEIDLLNAAFSDEVKTHIREWGVSLPFDKHASKFTEEDWSHPYWQFLNVIKLREISGAA